MGKEPNRNNEKVEEGIVQKAREFIEEQLGLGKKAREVPEGFFAFDEGGIGEVLEETFSGTETDRPEGFSASDYIDSGKDLAEDTGVSLPEAVGEMAKEGMSHEEFATFSGAISDRMEKTGGLTQ